MRVDFVRPSITSVEIAAAAAAVASGWLSAGPRVQEFGEKFAEHLGVDRVLPTSSCTSAIELVLRGLNLGETDAVLMSDQSFVSVANTVRNLGAVPVLVDVEPETMNMSPASLEAALAICMARYKLRPRAVVVTHMYGWPACMKEIHEVTNAYTAGRGAGEFPLVIEDCAHATWGAVDGQPIGVGHPRAGSFASVWSFHAIKNLACGEGGALLMDSELLDVIEPLVLHGMTKGAWGRYEDKGSWRYDVERPGLKANMADPAAAVGLVQLGRLPEMQARRKWIADHYLEWLNPLEDRGLVLPPTPVSAGTWSREEFIPRDAEHAWHLFVVQLPPGVDRARVMNRLAQDHEVGTNVHFQPLHAMTAYARPDTPKPYGLPVSRARAESLLSLPLYPDLTNAQAGYVVDAVTEVLLAELAK